MKSTIGFHIDNAGKYYSSVEYHNERKNKFKDKNKFINWKLTKYNQVGKLHDAKKLLIKECTPYVKKYNKRQLKQGHKKRCYKSVSDYIKKRGKSAFRRGTVSIGGTKFRTKFENKIIHNLRKQNPFYRKYPDSVIRSVIRIQIEPYILKDYLQDFNKRHNYLKICRYAVHVDERFIHAHTEIVAIPGMTNGKNPRPSFNINTALKREYPNAVHHYTTKRIRVGHGKNRHTKTIHGNFVQHDSKQALHCLQDDEANRLIAIANHYLNHTLTISLTRTGKASSLSGASYKEHAIARDTSSENARLSQATSNYSQVSNNTSKITSKAVSDALPLVGSMVASSTVSIKGNANQSASTSASIAVSKANEAISSANVIWKRQKSASLSISASNSAKAKASASMSAVAFSASSVSTANDELINRKADMMSNYCNMKINGHPLTSSQYQSCAKNGGYINGHHVNGDQIISSGLSLMSSKTKHTSEQASNYDYWKSSANSIHDDYNYWSASVSSISSASSSVTALHSSTRSMMTTTLMTFDNRTKAPTAKDKFEIYDKSNDSNLLAKFQDTLHTITDKVKSATRKIKLKLKQFIEPNKYAYSAMQDYINKHDESYSDIKNDTDKDGNPMPNAHTLNKKDTLNLFNYDTETVHNQRERNLGKTPQPPQ